MSELYVPGVILLLNVLSVSLIVMRQRFPLERYLRRNYGFDRHWWVPVLALATGVLVSAVSFSSIKTAFLGKFEIILLVFSFGMMAEGLRSSGFFAHLAYRIVDRSGGDTSRLLIYMFFLTSALTFFTSNDIVIYVLTPVIVTICFQAGIKNTKLLLVSQFVAANTASMGMLIGSPTNIIVAESAGLDFFSYLSMMILPASVAFLGTYLVLRLVIKVLRTDGFPFLSDMDFSPEYSIPDTNPEPVFDRHMRDWVGIFGFFVVLVAIVTFLNYSLIYCALPAIIFSLGYWHLSDSHETSVREPIGNLPYGVLFFGMSFFIFAEQFSRTGFINASAIPFLQNLFSGNTGRTAIGGIFGSGVMVSTFIDIPSAAIVSQVIPRMELAVPGRYILTQATLIGLNIGTYITSVGALAGLIWFEEIRIQRSRELEKHPELEGKMSFPDRKDLVRYGLLTFILTGLFAAGFLTVEGVLIDMMA